MRLAIIHSLVILLPILAGARNTLGHHHRRATSSNRLDQLDQLDHLDPFDNPENETYEYSEREVAHLNERGLLPRTTVTLGTNICIGIEKKTTIKVDGINVKLEANTCICIDGSLLLRTKPKVSLVVDGKIVSGTQANGGITLPGSVGPPAVAKTLLTGGLLLGIDICAQVDAEVNNPGSVHDFSNINLNGCCKRKCKDTHTLCGNQCVNKNDFTCVSNVPKPCSKKRDLTCPLNMSRCPVGLTGWECLDTSSNIESCGGCLHASKESPASGYDCTALPNVGEVACVSGQCEIRSCHRGWNLNANGTECEEKPLRSGYLSKNVSQWSGFGVQRKSL